MLVAVAMGLALMAAPPPEPFEPIPPEPVLVDFPLDERGVALAAAKTRIEVQASTQVITVITAEMIRDRGLRTLADALRLVPGFDGDRVDFYGWTEDALARGQPRTVLVLIDGVGALEPTRNLPLLDQRVPLDAVRRIEITSGPGSVMWGGEALLGVVHVITHDADSSPGTTVRARAGGGPGAPGLGEVSVSAGYHFSSAVSLYTAARYRTTRAPELTLDAARIVGPTPQPEPDGPSRFGPEVTTTSAARGHVATSTGQLHAGPVTLGWLATFSREPLPVSPGGAALESTYFAEGAGPRAWPDTLTSVLEDSATLLWLRYGATLVPEVDLSAQLSWSWWELGLSPLGVFPASEYTPVGLRTELSSEGSHRLGANVDVTARLPGRHRLIAGAEAQVVLGPQVNIRSFWPGGVQPVQPPEPGNLAGGPSAPCPSGYIYAPDLDAARPCSRDEVALAARVRPSGGVYVHDDWRVSDTVGLSAGARGYFTEATPALLISAGVVWQPVAELALRVGYGEGIRTPDFEALGARSGLVSGVTLQSNPALPTARSRAVDLDISGDWLPGVAGLRRWGWRAGTALTFLDDAVTRRAGQYDTSDRRILSAELSTTLDFDGGSSLFASYTFVRAYDETLGRQRNIPAHVGAVGGRLALLGGRLALASTLTVRGAMDDLNRRNTLGGTTGDPLGEDVLATELEVSELPLATLWRLGLESRGLLGGNLDVSVWVDDVLDTRPADPDLDYDDRVFSRPQPRPGRSVWAEVRVSF